MSRSDASEIFAAPNQPVHEPLINSLSAADFRQFQDLPRLTLDRRLGMLELEQDAPAYKRLPLPGEKAQEGTEIERKILDRAVENVCNSMSEREKILLGVDSKFYERDYKQAREEYLKELAVWERMMAEVVDWGFGGNRERPPRPQMRSVDKPASIVAYEQKVEAERKRVTDGVLSRI